MNITMKLCSTMMRPFLGPRSPSVSVLHHVLSMFTTLYSTFDRLVMKLT